MGAAKIKAPDTLFLPGQVRWQRDRSRLKIAEKARQVGWTWTTAHADLLATASVGNTLDLWITSRDELQARLYVQDCLRWARVYDIGASELGEEILNEEGRQTSCAVRCANGATLYSLSSNVDAQAGKRGRRRADEFALNKDNRQLYSIMYPGITWGGDLWIWSTHRGTQNYFNQLIQEIRHGGNPKGFSLHTYTLQMALEEGLLDKLQAKWPHDDPRQDWDEQMYFDAVRAECPDEETFNQEYMCRPSDDEGAYIDYDLLDSCGYPPGIDWQTPLDPDSEYYLGYDVGRKRDLSVLYLVEKTNGQYLTRRIQEMDRTPFTEQEQILYSYLNLPWVRRACLDATGIGAQLAEQARERFGPKVEPVTFTPGVKEDLAVTLRRFMEDRKFRIPQDRALIADFRSIRKETTSAGNIRYVGDRTSDGHADRFWAAALALHGAKSNYDDSLPDPVTPWGNNIPVDYDSGEAHLRNNNQMGRRPF